MTNIIAILDHIFQMPDWNEIKAGITLTILGYGVWKLDQGQNFFKNKEVALYLRNLCFAYVGTLVLTDPIQEEGLMLYVLWTVSAACWKQGFYGWLSIFWVAKMGIFWFFMLP